MGSVRTWCAAAGATAALAGCAGASDDEVRAVVATFADPGTAEEARCALLAPATLAALEFEASAPCPDAIGEVALPDGGVSAVEVWSGEAQVRVGDDVLFLTDTGAGWRITAAACEPRGEAPYDCEVDGP
ncbi:hypothetical protein [Blastococcus sp. CCUG 61487]|uniref:hypothetical protein n=1 Tax=Blastococcus sp. CCUG 61487 TaxID=1840703 RepID=UPI0010C03F38|nr:hypothetical protein [Blastococcus sp. CCUG 61487]TKJ19007.1 hypothetical protein A6V29_10590 [Blastococcus sp. CCUG 61487]